ncbi:hypothetical protein Pint_13065 [Pistacia integerrima]|uniref:Uncharacterized protein n=1 Tax=Pistacia integerrima TaxID=434235 RepID=A0ACC0Y729_9ROSI|nr:hypothetical protein Pint_13065 [Pistacia integerrima]
MEVVDNRLIENGLKIDERQVKRLIYVAFWCIQERARLRPSMARVVEMLEGRVTVDEPPETEMVIVDLLSIDEEDQPDGSDHGRKKIASLSPEVDTTLPTTSTCSYAMSVLSGR